MFMNAHECSWCQWVQWGSSKLSLSPWMDVQGRPEQRKLGRKRILLRRPIAKRGTSLQHTALAIQLVRKALAHSFGVAENESLAAIVSHVWKGMVEPCKTEVWNHLEMQNVCFRSALPLAVWLVSPASQCDMTMLHLFQPWPNSQQLGQTNFKQTCSHHDLMMFDVTCLPEGRHNFSVFVEGIHDLHNLCDVLSKEQ